MYKVLAIQAREPELKSPAPTQGSQVSPPLIPIWEVESENPRASWLARVDALGTSGWLWDRPADLVKKIEDN